MGEALSDIIRQMPVDVIKRNLKYVHYQQIYPGFITAWDAHTRQLLQDQKLLTEMQIANPRSSDGFCRVEYYAYLSLLKWGTNYEH